jgi:hypothetical protein
MEESNILEVKESVDYALRGTDVPDIEDNIAPKIELIGETPYKGTVISFGKIDLNEENDEQGRLDFEFIIWNKDDTEKRALAEDVEFRGLLASIILDLLAMSSNLEEAENLLDEEQEQEQELDE